MAGRVYQILPIVRKEDAVGRMALGVHQVCQSLKLESRIFTERRASWHLGEWSTGPFRSGALKDEPSWDGLPAPDLSFYHHSIGTQVAERFLRWPAGKRILIYQNITPPELLPNKVDAEWGLKQLESLVAQTDVQVATSQFNCADLCRVGAKAVRYVPLYLWNRLLSKSRRDKLVLYVGRIEPAKGVLEAARAFCDLADRMPDVRLALVGNTRARPEYVREIENLLRSRGHWHQTEMPGRVTDHKLESFYRRAGVLVSLSYHEGFCVPVVEAMRAQIPIVTHAAGSIVETVGQGAHFVTSRDSIEVSIALERALTDRRWAEALIERQRVEVRRFDPVRVAQQWASLIQELLGESSSFQSVDVTAYGQLFGFEKRFDPSGHKGGSTDQKTFDL